MSTWKFISRFALLLFVSTISLAQSGYSAKRSVAEKIIQVENNLTTWVKLDSNKNWNIYQRMKESHVNGLTLAVINNFKIDWVKSYGWADTAEKRPVTNETLFQSASIGKSLNGLAYLKLAQSGKVDLAVDINTYLQDWKFSYDSISFDKPISLTQLLSHTAGLGVHGFDGYKFNASLPSLVEILDGKVPANNPPVRSVIAPGVKFEYSGGGYEISELLAEKVTGLSYASFIQKTIFRPLKMENSTYVLKPPSKIAATAYRFDGKAIGCKYHLYPEKACGAGLWTTAKDIARFIIAVQQSLKSSPGSFISAASAKLMLTPALHSSNYGLGCFIEQKGKAVYFQHSGLNEGFSSQYFGSMKGGNGVVVLTNSDNTRFIEEVVNSVATVYDWKDFYPFVPKKIVSVPDSILDQYVGRYKFEGETTGPIITKENDGLYLHAPGSPNRWRMYFTSEKEFFMLEARWANQQFFTDEMGCVKGHYILGDKYKAVVNKIE